MIDTDATVKVNVTPTQCLRECNQDDSCSCTRYSRFYSMTCWKMQNCPMDGHQLHKCARSSRLDTYIRQGGPTPAPTTPGWEQFGTDVYCNDFNGRGQAITHRHKQNLDGINATGSYASQKACQAYCESAFRCKFYLWRHDENAGSKYTCVTFYACDNPVPYNDGDGGHVWKKPTSLFVTPAPKTGYTDLGMGRCCVKNPNAYMCRDPPHLQLLGQASACETRCSGDPGCFGYSTTDDGNCYAWTEKNLEFGGDLVHWAGARCNVKDCVLTESCPVCTDTPMEGGLPWKNIHHGTCYGYQVGICSFGTARPGFEGWLGEAFNYPERYCCACGGGVTTVPGGVGGGGGGGR